MRGKTVSVAADSLVMEWFDPELGVRVGLAQRRLAVPEEVNRVVTIRLSTCF